MIAVIADDFTGAAELAGIGLRYGLTVQLANQLESAPTADLVVINTNSRSLSLQEALEVTAQTIRSLQAYHPAFIYKKMDSVLRGYVLDELKVQMKCLGLKSALMMPANPSLGRTIVQGKYLVQGKLIHETGFANDPEFAIQSPEIRKMLRADSSESIAILDLEELLLPMGIMVGEAVSTDDMNRWAEKIQPGMALIGAGDFFEAILKKSFPSGEITAPPALLDPYLYISGTAFSKSQQWVRQMADDSGIVHYLSDQLLKGIKDPEWFERIAATLQKKHKAIIAIEADAVMKSDAAATDAQRTALSLRTQMAEIARDLISACGIREILIEGGSTAASILDALALTEFYPTHELMRGVIRMKAAGMDLYISVKPGSYELPAQIKAYFLSKHNPTI